jgi:hypothetical protein
MPTQVTPSAANRNCRTGRSRNVLDGTGSSNGLIVVGTDDINISGLVET